MQMERGRVGALPKALAPEVAAPPQPMKALPGARQITVKSFVFAGNTLLASEQLASAVAPFLDRPLDFSELKKAAVAVADAYRREGWVVRVAAVPAAEKAFSRAVLQTQPLGAALEAADADFDFAAWLVQALRRGWLAGVAMPGTV